MLSLAKIASVSKCAYHSGHKSTLPPRPRNKANTCVPSPPSANTPKRSLNQSAIKDPRIPDESFHERQRSRCVSTSHKACLNRMTHDGSFLGPAEPSANASANPNDGSSIQPGNDCREDASQTKSCNKSSFIVFTHEDVLREEVEGMRQDLHKERMKNAELWSACRKAEAELSSLQKTRDKGRMRESKSDSETANMKLLIARQNAEIKEHARARERLAEDHKSTTIADETSRFGSGVRQAAGGDQAGRRGQLCLRGHP